MQLPLGPQTQKRSQQWRKDALKDGAQGVMKWREEWNGEGLQENTDNSKIR